MKAKQKKIRVFDIDIESSEEFFEYMDKNLVLLKDYLLLIDGVVDARVINYLEENSLCFVIKSKCNLKTIDSSKKAKEQEVKQEEIQPKVEIVKEVIYTQSDEQKSDTLVINKPVRSGAVVENDGDIVVFGRVNSGAKVVSEANISVYGEIDGVVEANGDFAIIKSINKGYVIFNGDILEKDDFNGGLKKVVITSDGYKIEDL